MESKTHKYIIASASSACIAEIITFPICTLKTNYQNTNGASIIKIFQNIWNKHGICGFYNASRWGIFSQMLSTSTKYTWYQTLKNTIPNKFLAGVCSGILASLMTHPIDVIKIHYQMRTPFRPELKKHGLSLFYRGYSKTLIKSSIGSLCFFPLYDTFNGYIDNSSIAAMMSSVVSTIILQPIDYMKTRQIYGNFMFFQTNSIDILSKIGIKLFTKNTINNLQINHTNVNFIYKVLPYFKGLSLNLGRVVPHFVITMTFIDILMHL